MTFKQGSSDWNEMQSAIAAGAEIPKEQLVFHFVGRDKLERAKLMVMFKISKVGKDITQILIG